MAPSGKSPRPARQLIFRLGGLLLATVLVICWLILKPHATVVELSLLVSCADFVADQDAESKTAGDRSFKLFESPLALRYLGLKGVEKLAANLEGRGPVTLKPAAEGQIRIDAPAPFPVEVLLQGPTHLSITPIASGRRHGGGHQLKVEISAPSSPGSSGKASATAAPAAHQGWVASIKPSEGMSLNAKDVEISGTGPIPSEHVDDERYAVQSGSSQLLLGGGTATSTVTLILEPERKPATELRLLDLASGQISEARRLEGYVVAEPRPLEWQNHLVLLDPDAGDTEPVQPFKKDLRVKDVRFWVGDGLEAKSYLDSGQVRILEAKREPIAIDPDSFLTVELEPDQLLALRSFRRVDDHFEMVLRGKVKKLKIGPTEKLQTNVLPSTFEWIYTHQLAVLIYTVLAWIVGASLALFKLAGLLEK